jgi:PHP family Zn ribbon phosphoesterase
MRSDGNVGFRCVLCERSGKGHTDKCVRCNVGYTMVAPELFDTTCRKCGYGSKCRVSVVRTSWEFTLSYTEHKR